MGSMLRNFLESRAAPGLWEASPVDKSRRQSSGGISREGGEDLRRSRYAFAGPLGAGVNSGRIANESSAAAARLRSGGVAAAGSRGRSLGAAMMVTAAVMALCEECPRTTALVSGGQASHAFLHSALGGQGRGMGPLSGRLRGGHRAAGCSPHSPHFSSTSLAAPLCAVADVVSAPSAPSTVYGFEGPDSIFGLKPRPIKDIGALECLFEAVTDSAWSENDRSGGVAVAATPLATPPVKQPVPGVVEIPGVLTRKGDVLDGGRYTVVRKLGAGTFGAVYCAYDAKEGVYSAIKMQKPGKKYSQVALDEVELLRVCDEARERTAAGLGGRKAGDYVVKLNSHFEHAGPKGNQVCMDIEMLGPSLLDLIKDHSYKGCPSDVVKGVARHVLTGLDFLHKSCNIIHTDVKPENVLLTIPSEASASGVARDPAWWSEYADKANGGWQLKKGWSTMLMAPPQGGFESVAKLVDLGNACIIDKPFTQDIQTIEYRSPEAILGSGYGTAADMWSVGCLVFELLTGEYLFDPKEGKGRVKYEREEDLLALQQELLGDIPLRLSTTGKHSAKFFTPQGKMRHINALTYWGISDVLVDKYGFPRVEADECAEFLLPMLRFDPAERATAAEMLEHKWLSS